MSGEPMDEAAAQELRRFVHALSHDLQAPLAKIITISELLSEKLTNIDAADRDYLLRMHENGKKMKTMLDDLTRKYAPASKAR